MNVLYFMFEDLRPDLPAYGSDWVIAPNIERLARTGLVFDMAIPQVSVCAPSRTSMLTGLRPDKLGIYDFQHFGGTRFFRSIPSHFHRSGYQTAMAGKFHHWGGARFFSASYYGSPDWEITQKQEMAFHNASVTPDALHDEGFFRDAIIADKAISFMEEVKQGREEGNEEPWMLAVGFKATHMQYQMPKRFWDMYEGIEERLEGLLIDVQGGAATAPGRNNESSVDPYLSFPETAPLVSKVRSAESRMVHFMRSEGSRPSNETENFMSIAFNRASGVYDNKMVVSKRAWKELLRGYWACLTYADYQLGRVLNALEGKGVDNRGGIDQAGDTIIVFTADHGMHTGEKGTWAKWSLFEESSRVPLIICDPRYSSGHGQHYRYPVELIDLFPTLVDLTGTVLEKDSECDPDVNEEEWSRGGGDKASVPRNRGTAFSQERSPSESTLSSNETTTPTPAPTRAALKGEARVRNSEGKVFRHIYCDGLDGVSLAPLVRSGGKVTTGGGVRRKEFGMTQRMTCKTPGYVRKHPHETQNNVSSPGWVDHCPNKGIPRHPSVGAMGYSLRYIDYRYTAWLEFDVESYLPSLHRPPLAEELYYHPPGDNLKPQKTYWAEIFNLAPQADTASAKEGQRGMEWKQHAAQLHRSRLDLYNFLWHNSSFEHLFHSRLAQQTALLHRLKSRSKGPQRSEESFAPKFKAMVKGRVHVAHPHWSVMRSHYYADA